MTQEILILLLFVAAAGYMLRMVYRQFFAKRTEKGCAKGCGACPAIDVDNIAKKASASPASRSAVPK
jgi:hypothetical protein